MPQIIKKPNSNYSYCTTISIFGWSASLAFKHYSIVFLPATVVWLVWLVSQGESKAFSNLLANWEISLTMAFGSLVAGATSMGGGIVAFPVFTKVLAIEPHDAKVFSLAIQSVGMGAAALVIHWRKIMVEWRVIYWGTYGGIFGIMLGLGPLANILPASILKLSFSLILSSFAITLFILNKKPRRPHRLVPCWGNRERVIVVITGILGGVMSGMVGAGIDILIFIVMVVLFRVCEKIATPTSVILMALNAMCGFAMQVWVFDDFSATVQDYWLAAIPVVVIGAPVGALLCSYLTRHAISYILITLIAIELLTTLLIIPLTMQLSFTVIICFMLFSWLNYQMFRCQYYATAVLQEPLK